MNYTPIKKAMIALGFPIEDNELWGHKEAVLFRDFSHFYLNVPADKARGILQYPEHFATTWARIFELGGTDPQPVADIIPKMPEPAAAPVEPEAPVEQPPVETIEETPMIFNVMGGGDSTETTQPPVEQPPVENEEQGSMDQQAADQQAMDQNSKEEE